MDEVQVMQLLKAAAAGDHASRERLLDHYRHFAIKVARQVCRRGVDQHDDEFSVALLALNEAIDGYAADQGASFTGYARMVIRRRLIDHLRRERRHQHLSLEPEAAPMEGSEAHPIEVEQAHARHVAAEHERDLALEVAEFRRQLRAFGLDISDLVEATPRHRDTREQVQQVARALAQHRELYERMLRTRRLPIQELMDLTGTSRKVHETWRRYIIAIALVLGGDFEGMKAHLSA